MTDQIPWHIKGDYIEACNCDFGCPCNYSGFPSNAYFAKVEWSNDVAETGAKTKFGT